MRFAATASDPLGGGWRRGTAPRPKWRPTKRPSQVRRSGAPRHQQQQQHHQQQQSIAHPRACPTNGSAQQQPRQPLAAITHRGLLLGPCGNGGGAGRRPVGVPRPPLRHGSTSPARPPAKKTTYVNGREEAREQRNGVEFTEHPIYAYTRRRCCSPSFPCALQNTRWRKQRDKQQPCFVVHSQAGMFMSPELGLCKRVSRRELGLYNKRDSAYFLHVMYQPTNTCVTQQQIFNELYCVG